MPKLQKLLNGNNNTYFCEDPISRNSNGHHPLDVQAYLRTAQGTDNSLFFIKTWTNPKEPRCKFELDATTTLALGGSHKNILLPSEIIENKQGMHFVYPLLDGITLEDYIVSNPKERDFHKVLHILESVGGGLEYTHSQNVVHRDIKPRNIFLKTEKNESYGFRPVVFDWDIAGKIGEVITPLTRGTPVFMSPEQLLVGFKVKSSSDLYALGMMIYLMIDDNLPIDCGNGTERDIIQGQFNPNRRKLQGENIPESLGAVVDKMVTKFWYERYQNGQEMTKAFREAI